MIDGKTFDHIVLFKHPSVPIVGTADAANWSWPGTACTANTFKLFPAMLPGLSLLYARWILAWNPMTADAPTSVRLVVADDGPSNIVEIAKITRTEGSTPFDDGVIITEKLAPWWSGCQAQGLAKNVGHQTCGNGQNGCLIYTSWVEITLG